MAHSDDFRQSVTAFAKTLDLPSFVHELNELLNQRAWEQAAEKEKIAMQKIADMWMIVQAVATEKSTYWHDNLACQECPFCHGREDFRQEDGVRHEQDCIVTKARELVQAIKQTKEER